MTNEHDSTRTERHVRTLWASCTLGLFMVWVGLAAVVVDYVQEDADKTRIVTSHTAKGFSEYVGVHLAVVDGLLRNLRGPYQSSRSLPRHQTLADEFPEIAPILLQVAVSDKDGRVTASSLQAQPTGSIADRKHFQYFKRDPSDRFHITPPLIGRISSRMSLQVVRPLRGQAGEFDGVIVGSVDPLKLHQYFESFPEFYIGRTISIVGLNDAIMIARFDGSSISWGQFVGGHSTWETMRSRISGSLEALSPIDGMNRIISFHRVPNFPLLVIVGEPPRTWDALLDGRIGFAAAMVMIFSLTLVWLTMVLTRRAREQEALISGLQASQEREGEANRMKSNFLASVSHDLRTPLNSILGFSELICAQSKDPQLVKFSGLIHDAGQHLHSLVNTLLDLAKIEAGRMELQIEEVDLGQTVRTLAQVHEISASKKGLDMILAMDLPPGCTAVAQTDQTKLVQVLNNVLHNAVKFTTSGAVRMTATLQDSYFFVDVVDTGPGIKMEHLANVFERFNRSDESCGGAGLGLSLSRDLMALLGGTISVTSEPGSGTRVRIQLPGAMAVPDVE